MLLNLGMDPRAAKRTAQGLPVYRANKRVFTAQERASRHEFVIAEPFPCPGDRFDEGGTASGQYFHQDLYVAQQIFEAKPDRHIDVGSRVDGFVAHVASFQPIEVLDIRTITRSVRNITFRQRNIMEPDPATDGTVASLSCLHTLEHFGLGRYGDPVDYYGYRKGWDNMVRMLTPGGRFYFSVPVSEQQRIEFDAHRIFSLPYLRDEMIGDLLEIEALAYVDDAGDLQANQDPWSPDAERTFGLDHGCGIFTLRRR